MTDSFNNVETISNLRAQLESQKELIESLRKQVHEHSPNQDAASLPASDAEELRLLRQVLKKRLRVSSESSFEELHVVLAPGSKAMKIAEKEMERRDRLRVAEHREASACALARKEEEQRERRVVSAKSTPTSRSNHLSKVFGVPLSDLGRFESFVVVSPASGKRRRRRKKNFTACGGGRRMLSTPSFILTDAKSIGYDQDDIANLENTVRIEDGTMENGTKVKPNVPLIVRECIEFLQQNAVEEEGIFRHSASASLLGELKLLYDTNANTITENNLLENWLSTLKNSKNYNHNDSDINNAVAGILKLFFRELPEPLFPLEIYDSLLTITSGSDLKSNKTKVKRMCSLLNDRFRCPVDNQQVIALLLTFLHQVAENPGNKMSASNLAVCLAPTLLRPSHRISKRNRRASVTNINNLNRSVDDPICIASQVSEVKAAAACVEFIISNGKEISELLKREEAEEEARKSYADHVSNRKVMGGGYDDSPPIVNPSKNIRLGMRPAPPPPPDTPPAKADSNRDDDEKRVGQLSLATPSPPRHVELVNVNEREEQLRRRLNLNLNVNEEEKLNETPKKILEVDTATAKDSPIVDVKEEERRRRESDLSIAGTETPNNPPPVPPILLKRRRRLHFLTDCPAFDYDLERQCSELQIVGKHLENIGERIREFCESATETSRVAEIVSTEIRDLSKLQLLAEQHRLELSAPEDSEVSIEAIENRMGGLQQVLLLVAGTLEEMKSAQGMLNASLETALLEPLRMFLNAELEPLAQSYEDLQKSKVVYEHAIKRYLHSKPSRTGDDTFAQLAAEVEASRREYELQRFDMTALVNKVEGDVNVDLAENFLSGMYAFLVFFHHLDDHTRSCEVVMRGCLETIPDARKLLVQEQVNRVVQREELNSLLQCTSFCTAGEQPYGGSGGMERIGSSKLNGKETRSSSVEEGEDSSSSRVRKAGYLLKLSTSLRHDWKRRWFFVQHGKLWYTHCQGEEPLAVADLAITMVRPNHSLDMRFCFDVVAPNRRVYTLQAGSELEMSEWLRVLQETSEGLLKAPALSRSGKDGEKYRSLIKEMCGLSPQCADCNAVDPEWASINLGVLLCINCSGVHRSLGVNISVVKSITMDSWPEKQIKLLLAIGGNDRANSVWECKKQAGWEKPKPNSSREERSKYINAKYRWMGFVDLGDIKSGRRLKGNKVSDSTKMDNKKKDHDWKDDLCAAVKKGDVLQMLGEIATCGHLRDGKVGGNVNGQNAAGAEGDASEEDYTSGDDDEEFVGKKSETNLDSISMTIDNNDESNVESEKTPTTKMGGLRATVNNLAGVVASPTSLILPSRKGSISSSGSGGGGLSLSDASPFSLLRRFQDRTGVSAPWSSLKSRKEKKDDEPSEVEEKPSSVNTAKEIRRKRRSLRRKERRASTLAKFEQVIDNAEKEGTDQALCAELLRLHFCRKTRSVEGEKRS